MHKVNRITLLVVLLLFASPAFALAIPTAHTQTSQTANQTINTTNANADPSIVWR